MAPLTPKKKLAIINCLKKGLGSVEVKESIQVENILSEVPIPPNYSRESFEPESQIVFLFSNSY